MIKTFLESLEDPEQPFLGPNYWIMKKLGLLLPKKKLHKIAYIILHEMVTLFVITQYMELYVIRSELDQVLANLRTSTLSILCVVKTNSFAFWQKEWRKVIDYIAKADKYERDNKNVDTGKIIESYTKYCRRITYFYWVIVVMTCITVISTPFARLASQNFREELRNGTKLFPHIFSAWMPYDQHQSPGCWFTVVLHSLNSIYGASVIAAYDTSAIVMMVFFGGKLDLLRERCKRMLGSTGVGISDEDAGKFVKQLHHIYVLLTEHSRLFNSLLSPVMFFYVVICSVMLCASAFELTFATNTAQVLIMSQYLIFGISQLFMFCWHSNDVLIKSQNVIFGLYDSEWWASNIRQRKNVLILTGQFRINHIYTAGPFTNLTLSTFITILKGAYSYYTLLRK